MILALSALAWGVLHGLGADHLMAIAALAVGDRPAGAVRGRAFGVAVRFAAGHALVLAASVCTLAAVGWTVPVAVERMGERLGGVLLVALGAAGVWAAATGHLYGHAHGDADEPRPHWHVHVGHPDRHPGGLAHVSHLPTLVGALFAVGSLRAMTVLASFGGDAEGRALLGVLGLVVLFGVGVLLAMSLFGVVLARVVSTAIVSRLGTGASLLTSLASVALGVCWILRS